MPEFEIQYGERSRDHVTSMTFADFHWFLVGCGDSEETVGVAVTNGLRQQWRLDTLPNGRELESRVALRHLKEHLASITALSPHRILLTTRQPPKLGEGWTVHQAPEESPYQWKECHHRLGKHGEYHCSAAKEDDDWGGRTTLAICQGCGLPSSDIACSNLGHPSTQSFHSIGPDPPTRQLRDVQCELGRRIGGDSAGECVPGGRDCWIQIYEPQEPPGEAGERNLAAEALDMVDTLNTIFRDQFDADLFRLKQFRTGRVLMEPCTTQESLEQKLHVLADLIDLINSKELGQAQEVTAQPGSVNWLAAFLERVGQGDSAPVIQPLRDIRTIRKQLTHSAAASDFVDACARLGIALPLVDWDGAWRQVLSAFLDALRRLQALLP